MSQRFRTVQATIFTPGWSHESIDTDFVQYYICQKEKCPDTGRIHYHVHLELKNQTRLTTIQNTILNAENCHVEKVMNIKKDIEYCSKDESRIEGPWEYGEPKEPGKRTDLIEVANKIKNGYKMSQIVDENMETYIKYHKGIEKAKMWMDKKESKKLRNIEVTLIWGKSGSGKSKYVYEHVDMENCFKLDRDSTGIWWDGYDGETVLWIDDFTSAWIQLGMLLNILDRYPLRLQTKGGHVWANWKTVYITSNTNWKDWYINIAKEHTKAIERRIKNVIECKSNGVSDVSEVAGNTIPQPTTEVREELE